MSTQWDVADFGDDRITLVSPDGVEIHLSGRHPDTEEREQALTLGRYMVAALNSQPALVTSCRRLLWHLAHRLPQNDPDLAAARNALLAAEPNGVM